MNNKLINLNFGKYLNKIVPSIITLETYFKNELIITVPSYNIKEFLLFLRDHTNCQFKVLSDICAVDFLKRSKRFVIVYNILSIKYNTRLRIKTFVNELTPINSITAVYSCANWWEREIWDLFGVFFSNHPDLRRILTDYGFEGHPFRKDFPLSGFIELKYNDVNKCILAKPVVLSQKFKFYNFTNNLVN
jgi:NADH dehydrogenase (ubiquinone) Fe-S protein 3